MPSTLSECAPYPKALSIDFSSSPCSKKEREKGKGKMLVSVEIRKREEKLSRGWIVQVRATHVNWRAFNYRSHSFSHPSLSRIRPFPSAIFLSLSLSSFPNYSYYSVHAFLSFSPFFPCSVRSFSESSKKVSAVWKNYNFFTHQFFNLILFFFFLRGNRGNASIIVHNETYGFVKKDWKY